MAAMDARRINDSVEGMTAQKEEVENKGGRLGADVLCARFDLSRWAAISIQVPLFAMSDYRGKLLADAMLPIPRSAPAEPPHR